MREPGGFVLFVVLGVDDTGSVRGRFLWLAVGIGACTAPSSAELAVTGVTPASGINTQVTPIQIQGTGFRLPIRSDLDTGETTVVGGMQLAIGNTPLGNVVRQDDRRIDGDVPTGLAPGPYDVTVTFGERTAVLPGGFTVTDTTVTPDGGTTPPPATCDSTDLDQRVCLHFDNDTIDGSSYGNDVAASAPSFVIDRNGGGALVTTTGTNTAAATTSLDVGKFTIKLWVNASSIPTGGARAGLFDSSGRFRMFLESDGALRCAISPGGTFELVTAINQIPIGVWTRVACTYDGTTMAIYVDGQQRDSAQLNATVPAAGAGFVVGHNSPSGENFDGAIDDLEVWGSVVAP